MRKRLDEPVQYKSYALLKLADGLCLKMDVTVKEYFRVYFPLLVFLRLSVFR